MKKELYTAPEIAKICRTSRQNVNTWINQGVLKAFRPTDTAVWKVTRNDLIIFLQERGYPTEFLNFHNDDKIRILVVDDEVDITTLISIALKKERNFQIEIANSGFKAGVKLTEFKPDIVILDIYLGDMDGREFFKHIKEDSELKEIKVVGISGKIDPDEEQSLLDMGFNSFIRKPFKINKIIDTILEIKNVKTNL